MKIFNSDFSQTTLYIVFTHLVIEMLPAGWDKPVRVATLVTLYQICPTNKIASA